MTTAQRAAAVGLLLDLWPDEVRHGDCEGADFEWASAARAAGCREIVGHPPTNPKLRGYFPSDRELEPEPYLDRDRAIVLASGVVLAAPKEFTEQQYGGTWYTVRFARACRRPLFIVLPDGAVRAERAGRFGLWSGTTGG